MYLMLQLNYFQRLFLIFKLEENIKSIYQSLFLGCAISILFNKIEPLLCAKHMSLAIRSLGLSGGWEVKVSVQTSDSLGKMVSKCAVRHEPGETGLVGGVELTFMEYL